MSSEGPKMVGGRYGLAENGLKVKKIPVTHGGCRRRFAGPIRALPTAVGRETLPARSSGGRASPWPTRVAGGWPVMPPLVQNSTAHKWVKTTQLGVQDFGEFFLGFWSSRWCFGG